MMGWGYPGEGDSPGQEKVGNSTRILAQGGPSNLHVNKPQGIEVPDFEGHCLHRGLSYLCWPRTV